MAHKHLTTSVLPWFQNNQEFNKEQSLPSHQVTSKYGSFSNAGSEAELPSNDFTST